MDAVAESYAVECRALVQRIKEVDALIDRVSYYLSSLTEEEIPVVEGKG